MSDDIDTSRRDYRGPYNKKHKVPTVKKYREFKDQQRQNNDGPSAEDVGGASAVSSSDSEEDNNNGVQGSNDQGTAPAEDTTESTPTDPKTRRKELKHRKTNRAERQVTDPVTHLPVTIRDYTDADFTQLEEEDDQEKDPGAQPPARSSTNSSLSRQEQKQRADHQGLEDMFPPPEYQEARQDLERLWRKAMAFAVICVVGICVTTLAISATFLGRMGALVFVLTVGTGLCTALTLGLQSWIQKKVQAIWEDEVWQAERIQAHRELHSEHPESTRWFNKLIGSIWPLINPEIFASLGDTLEDVMQASLPSMVRMVSIDDLGQGSDAIRFLGVKWLPAGAAGKTVSAGGKLEGKSEQDKKKKDEQKSGKSDEQEEAKDDASKDMYQRGCQNQDEQGDQKDGDEGQEANVAGGMEAEEGEFVNLEIAFAYRSTHSRRKFKDRAKHAHMYMAFYLPGNIKLPVWVELQGLVGSLRIRMQLSPDPPFVGLATMTFLGQPKVEISCTPLFKRMPNLMDLPLISNFVQSAVDAAMAEYVAPKSYTMDLKAMLAGDDFKKDTAARGVVVVKIKRAFDFKASDMDIPLVRSGSSDGYVSVGWAKFGKPLFSTRVIVNEMEPWWQEETVLLVGPEELDAEENLRVQLWDSDRTSADDDLGRIELPIKQLMKSEKSNGKMWDRVDGFRSLKAGESMPGRLEWSVGYYTKTRLMDYQVQHASGDKNIITVSQLKEKSFTNSKAKLREAAHSETTELEQLKTQDFEDASIEMISQSPPSTDYPSGILSVQIHQITNLELERLNHTRDAAEDDNSGDDDDQSPDLPSPYAMLIINHKQVFRTRTKPKNAKPFFNAGTERYIRDWRTAEVMVAVRDARIHEDDALLGMVHLPLGKLFMQRQTSQFNEFYPITGGIGYGRVRISVVFRSIKMQAPAASLGWDFGTIEIAPSITAVGGQIRTDLESDRLKFRTNMARAKAYSNKHHYSSSTTEGNDGIEWKPKHNTPIRLPVRNRYRQPLVIEFRTHSTLRDTTPAFCVLWLHAIPDNVEQDVELVVWKGDLKRAQVNCLPGDQMGEKVGMVRLKITFWRGIGKLHAKYAQKASESMKNVVDVLYCAKDQGLIDCMVGDDEWLRRRREGRVAEGKDAYDVDITSDSDSENEDGARDDLRVDMPQHEESEEEVGERQVKRSDTENSGGMVEGVKSYINHHHQLHRRHRGVMQHKIPRTMKWMEGKVEGVAQKIGDKFGHKEREPGIETEV